ncbi:hypothetical protein HOLleu_30908 [Holothuria leucospilota]|uniref:Uncharacterized protein n=1 Tax=Holothuria leucospilota TaxID=206669 RepID=A0A9Q1BL47_HOLLE|nr:hypothetical protein HOLleu_30908 [Holothuria leucospilota]
MLYPQTNFEVSRPFPSKTRVLTRFLSHTHIHTHTHTHTHIHTHKSILHTIRGPHCYFLCVYFLNPNLDNRLSIVQTFEDLTNLLNFLQRTSNPLFRSSV